ncbi:cytochrome P450 [Streptomyces violascens]|uniref:cytochrome P450 n=1 Tax=Streptomyces violascens TaxID=67381 RepID=UPI0027E49FE2|nr:cytochrome P450 [Streptomyces violascens]
MAPGPHCAASERSLRHEDTMTAPALPFPTVPGAVPLLGHLPHMARSPLAFFRRLPSHGPVVRLRVARREVLAVTSPRLAHRIHVDDQHLFDKGGPLSESMKDTLGDNLVTCPAGEHARQRPLMNPAFHSSRMPAYSDVIREAAVEVATSWKAGQTVRLDREAHRLAALAVTRSLVSAPAAADAASVLAAGLDDISQGIYVRSLFPGQLFAKLPLPVNRRYEQQMARIRQAMKRVTAQYRAAGDDYGDVLSKVVPACEEAANPQQAVHDQVLGMVFGGVETTAAALVWTLRLIDQYQVAGDLHQELRDVLGGSLPSHEHIDQLDYMRRVVTEALRLHPPAWLGTRISTAPVPWTEGTIPPETAVLFSPYALNRDPDLFENPDRFDPDRWNRESVTPEQRRYFFPFGAGTRKCIGHDFAMNEVILALAVILTSWDLRHHSTPTARHTPRFIMGPPPTPVTVQPR